MFRKMTTGEVYGLDISPGMIEKAKEQQKEDDKEITYVVQDASAPFKLSKEFDVVALTWLLAHSSGFEMTKAFLKNVYANLRPGGRVVSIGMLGKPYNDMVELQKYGFYEIKYPQEVHDGIRDLREGDFAKVRILAPGLDLVLDDYWIPEESFTRALEEVGFVNIKWHPLTLSPEWPGEKNYWDKFLEHSAHGFFTANKPE